MAGTVQVYNMPEACELLSNPAFSDLLFTEPFDPNTGYAKIIPLEKALAERFECDITTDGLPHLSFGLESTWKAIDGFYRRRQIVRPEHLYAGFDASDSSEVQATYVVPLAGTRQKNRAIITICKYGPKDISSRGKTYHKLSRQTMKRPTVVDNPF